MKLTNLISAAVVLAVLTASTGPVDAQLDLGGVVQRAAESETKHQVDRLTRKAVRCAFDNMKCIEKAKKKGKPVVLTDENGEIMTDDEGNPITDPSQIGGKPPGLSSGGTGSSFVAGSRVLFEKDFATVPSGGFPDDLELIQGQMRVVEWNGESYLRTEEKYSRMAVTLPEELPHAFTVEFDLFEGTAGGDGINIALVEPPRFDFAWHHYYDHNYLNVGHRKTVGLWAPKGEKIVAVEESRPSESIVPIKIRVEGDQLAMYVGSRQVVTNPNASLGRSDRIYFFLDSLPPDNLTYIGNIRVAAVE